MFKRLWQYLINTFEVNTQGSNVKMLSLANDTYAKLQKNISDPVVAAIMADYDPVYQAYKQIYQNYDVVSGNREGNTLSLQNILTDDLPIEIRKWEGAVRNVYIEDSPEEKAIFPNKRNPFLKSTYDDRISAIGSLRQKLSTDTNFTSLTTQVQSFYNLISSARDTQQQEEGFLEQLSNIRENQRTLMATELYGALGALMNRYKAQPAMVESFFDVSLLRKGEDDKVLSSIEGTIAAGAFANLGLLPTGAKRIKITLINGGPLEIGLSTDGTTYNGNTATIGGIGNEIIEIEDLNSIGTIILLRNQSASVLGSYKVEALG
jgi:hypothetical protein